MGIVSQFPMRVQGPTTGHTGLSTKGVTSPPQQGEPLIREYITSMTRRRLSPNTIRLRVFYIQKFLTHHDPRTVTLEDLETFIEDHPNWSENTQQAAVASLRSFYSWAARVGTIPTNPARDLLTVRVHRRPSRIATDTDIRRGLTCGTIEQQAMILLGAECGLRVTEIAKLHKSMRDDRWLHIVGKGGGYRDVYMSPELAALLTALECRPSLSCYFPGRTGQAMHSSTVWRHIRDTVGVNPHALRHRAGTVVYRNTGCDLRTTQEFLGHAKSSTTEIYVHVERDDLMRASTASRIAA